MGVLSIREFNANASAVFARVEAGETIRITNRGRPVARIEPDRPRPEPGTPEWQAAYDRMVKRMDDGTFAWGGRVTYEDKHG